MKKKKQKTPLPDIAQAASMTECTGLLPAQVEGDEEAEATAALQGIFPVRPPEGR